MSSKKLFISIMTLTVTIFTCVASVFAWFFNAQTGMFGGVNIDASNVLKTVVSQDGSTWQESMTFGSASYNFSLLSGTGTVVGEQLNLVRPVVDGLTGQVEVNSSGQWLLDSAPQKDVDFIEFDLYVKTNLQSVVSFGEETYVRPKVADVANNQRKASKLGYTQSQYGSFSIDYLSAATRMSINKVDDNGETLLCLWAPNENVRLRCVDLDKFVLYTDESQFSSDSTQYLFTEFQYLQSYSFYDNAILTERTVESQDDWFVTDIGDFSYEMQLTDAQDGAYVSHFVIRIWMEGCDAEAHSALATGDAEIEINLQIATTLVTG